ncbi:MAG: YraN family protein [Vicinamibacterales bacterium]
MTFARQRLGVAGEEIACHALEARGYAIVERRYRTRAGEIDIVARHEGYLVFVEVKARQGSEYGDGADAVTPSKQRRLVAMATDYLARHQLGNVPCRFDVVAVGLPEGRAPEVTVYPDAFRPGWP